MKDCILENKLTIDKQKEEDLMSFFYWNKVLIIKNDFKFQ